MRHCWITFTPEMAAAMPPLSIDGLHSKVPPTSCCHPAAITEWCHCHHLPLCYHEKLFAQPQLCCCSCCQLIVACHLSDSATRNQQGHFLQKQLLQCHWKRDSVCSQKVCHNWQEETARGFSSNGCSNAATALQCCRQESFCSQINLLFFSKKGPSGTSSEMAAATPPACHDAVTKFSFWPKVFPSALSSAMIMLPSHYLAEVWLPPVNCLLPFVTCCSYWGCCLCYQPSILLAAHSSKHLSSDV